MVRFSDIFKKHFEQPVKTNSSSSYEESKSKDLSNPSKEQSLTGLKHGILIRLPPRDSQAIKSSLEVTKSSEPAKVDTEKISLVEPAESKIPMTLSSRTSLAEIIKTKDVPLSEKVTATKKINGLDLAEAIKIQQIEDVQKAGQLYQAMSNLVERILAEIEKNSSFQEVSIEEITKLIDEVVTLVIKGDRSLLDLTYRGSFRNYLIFHMVNVCILSIEMGKTLGYNKSKLEELGLAALLHDLGMQPLVSLVDQADVLSPVERESIKKHIFQGQDILEGVEGMINLAKIVSQQHHERINGKGYQGITDKQIHEAAQLVGLADVFEAMTHPRPHRKKKSVQEVLKGLLEGASGEFDKNLLRILVKRIGIYPVGSWVEFNTGEVGRVAHVNERFLLRPIVQVVFNAQRQKVRPIRTFDLSKNPNVFIKSFMDESDLEAEVTDEVSEKEDTN